MATTAAQRREAFNIWLDARKAAQAAAEVENGNLPPESKRGFDVGFAWITIRPARGPLVSSLKRAGIGRAGGYGSGGYGIWYGDLHNLPTQSVDVHAAAVRAAAEVLQRHGFDASWSSRLD